MLDSDSFSFLLLTLLFWGFFRLYFSWHSFFVFFFGHIFVLIFFWTFLTIIFLDTFLSSFADYIDSKRGVWKKIGLKLKWVNKGWHDVWIVEWKAFVTSILKNASTYHAIWKRKMKIICGTLTTLTSTEHVCHFFFYTCQT